MRHRQSNDALRCKYVDVILEGTTSEPKLVIMPKPYEKGIKPAADAMDIACAKALAANITEFMRILSEAGPQAAPGQPEV